LRRPGQQVDGRLGEWHVADVHGEDERRDYHA
jgi:hypothetical protein